MTSRHFVVILGVVAALSGCTASPDALLARAGQEFAGHDYKAAQLDLATVLKALPADARAMELHARTMLALGDGDGALVSLGAMAPTKRPADFALLRGEAALLRQRPDDAVAAVANDRSAEGWRIRAMAALIRNDAAGAGRAFAAGEGAPGPAARLLADEARWQLHGGKLDAARALADRALKAEPGSLDAQLVDAQVAVATGDLARGLAAYDAVGKAWPGNLAALVGKAGVLGDLGRTREMDEVLAAATRAGASADQLVFLQARRAAAKADWNGARDVLQANEARLAGRSDATLLHAQVLVKLGQPEQARALLQPLLTHEPGNAAARRLLAEAALAAHDPAGAVEALKPLAAMPGAASSDLRLLAEAARAAGNPDAGALAARARFPTPQELARTLADADVAMKAHNWGNAIAAYERIMAVTDGRNPLVLNNLAFAQQQVGNRTVALGYALRALKEAPGDPSVMDTAAWLMIQAGQDKDRALALLREAARKAPGNATIRDHLAAAERG